ncbi:MAG: hypothetical protein ABIW16_00825 [Sphingomicrobium sp.]
MRKQNIENAAFDVATQVRAVEDIIDDALAQIAELQGKMVHARSVTGIGVIDSHAAFEQLVGAVQALVGARGSVGACHVALATAASFVPGLRAVGFGEGYPCPPKSVVADLRVVA